MVNSLLGVDFWQRGGLDTPWWDEGLPENYLDLWRESGKLPSVLAAIQWRFIIESARDEARLLEADAYCEVNYEDFVKQPEETLEHLLKFAGLEKSDAVERYIHSIPERKASINREAVFGLDEDRFLTEICSAVDLTVKTRCSDLNTRVVYR